MQLHQGRLIVNVPSPRIVTINGRQSFITVDFRRLFPTGLPAYSP
jgi:hypothetical protein